MDIGTGKKTKLGIGLAAVLAGVLLVGALVVFGEEKDYTDLYNKTTKVYEIKSVEDLKLFRNSLQEYNYAGEKVVLGKDINIKKEDDIGDTKADTGKAGKFAGYFDGQGFSVTGFHDIRHGLLGGMEKGSVATRLHLSVALEGEQIEPREKGSISIAHYGALADTCMYGRVQYCSIDGVISSEEATDRNVAGLVGYFTGGIGEGYIRDCRADINIDVRQNPQEGKRLYVGGIVAYTDDSEYIDRCLSLGTVSKDKGASGAYAAFPLEKVKGNDGYGWYIQESESESYYNAENTQPLDSGEFHSTSLDKFTRQRVEGALGKTGAELQSEELYRSAGWDMEQVWEMGEDGYPRLRKGVLAASRENDGAANAYLKLYDEMEKEYLIEDVEDLRIFRNSLRYHNYVNEKVVLCRDIGLQPEDDIGSLLYAEEQRGGQLVSHYGNFKGWFDGGGHTISGFCDGETGLFGDLAEGNLISDKGLSGVVTRLNLEVDVELKDLGWGGSPDYGCIANSSGGRIQYCTVTGSVRGARENRRTGGVTGKFTTTNYGYIRDCFVNLDVDVASAGPVAGIAVCTERAASRVGNCLFAGSVKNSGAGGSYAAVYGQAEEGLAEGSFYDIEKAGVEAGIPGEKAQGKSTGELTEKACYREAGWDFDKVWNMDETGTPVGDVYYGEYTEADLQPGGKYAGWIEVTDELGMGKGICASKTYINGGYPYLRRAGDGEGGGLEPTPYDPTGKTYYLALTVDYGKREFDDGDRFLEYKNWEPQVTVTQVLDSIKKPVYTNPADIEGFLADNHVEIKIGGLDFKEAKANMQVKDQTEANGGIKIDLSGCVASTACSASAGTEGVALRIDADLFRVTGDVTFYLNRCKYADFTKAQWQSLVPQMVWESVVYEGAYKNITGDSQEDWWALTIARFEDFATEDMKYDFEGLYEEFFEHQRASGVTFTGLITDNQRTMLAVAATGYDPEDIVSSDGMTLPQAVYNEVGAAGAMAGGAFWLISLDSIDWVPPEAEKGNPAYTDAGYEAAVQRRLDKVRACLAGLKSGGEDGTYKGTDVTGMYAQAVARYYAPQEGTIYWDVAQRLKRQDYDVKEIVDKAAEAMAGTQSVMGYWAANSRSDKLCSGAQSVTFLSVTGHDVMEAPYITPSGYSPMAFYLSHWEDDKVEIVDEKTLKLTGDGTMLGDRYNMRRNQGAYAALAWLRMSTGAASLYDFSDVKGVRYVEGLIRALPEPGTELTEEQQAAVQEAKKAYQALSKHKRSYVDNTEKLELLLNEKLVSYEDLYDESQNAYVIHNAEELKLFREAIAVHSFEDEKVVLASDIALEADTDTGDVNGTFQGTFDGENHRITGFRDGTKGLFHYIGASAAVRNLHLEIEVEHASGEVFAANKKVSYGPLAVASAGVIEECSVRGSIGNGTLAYLGGLAGQINKLEDGADVAEMPIRNCYVDIEGQASATEGIGGLAGFSSEKRTLAQNCFVNGVPRNTSPGSAMTALRYATIGKSKVLTEGTIYNGDKIGELKIIKGQETAISLPAEDLRKLTTYQDWNIGGEGESAIWSITADRNDGLPYLCGMQVKEIYVKVAEQINALPEASAVTLEHAEAIQAARRAYDGLSGEQQAKIDAATLQKLMDAENALKVLEEKEKDRIAAAAVAEKIAALPEASDVTLEHAEAVKEAREAYEALTESQKLLVADEVLTRLTDAEKALSGSYYKKLYDEDQKAYVIHDAEELKWFREAIAVHSFEGEKVVLASDIALEADTDTGDVNGTFQGTFDGENHRITGFRDGTKGLFHYIGASAAVRNLHLEIEVEHASGEVFGGSSNGKTYGPLAVVSAGVIEKCSVRGEIKGGELAYLGGLVGQVNKLDDGNAVVGTPIRNCYVDIEGEASASYGIGNLAAFSKETTVLAENCFINSSIKNSSKVGGTRFLYATIAPAKKSTGTYYNNERLELTDKQKKQEKATAKTAEELRDITTYTGWNISTEDTESIWTIAPDKNNGLPYLRGMNVADTPPAEEPYVKVAEQISALPETEELALADAQAVEDARAAYDSLSEDQQAKIDAAMLQKLTDAEAAIKTLKEKEEAEKDQAAADAVTEQLLALPDAAEVTLETEADITAAREAYESLTENQKPLVTEEALGRLAGAEKALETIKENLAADQAAADAVKEQIEALPGTAELALGDAQALTAAQDAFDSLTDSQKALVPEEAQKKLLELAERLEELRAAYAAEPAVNAIKGLEEKLEEYKAQDAADRSLDLDFADRVKDARGLYEQVEQKYQEAVTNRGILEESEQMLADIVYGILRGLPDSEDMEGINEDGSDIQATEEDLEAIAWGQEAYRALTGNAQELLKAIEDGDSSGAKEVENLRKAAALAEKYQAYVDTYERLLLEKLTTLAFPVTRENLATARALAEQYQKEALAQAYVDNEENVVQTDEGPVTLKARMEEIRKGIGETEGMLADIQAVKEAIRELPLKSIQTEEEAKETKNLLAEAEAAYDRLKPEAQAEVENAADLDAQRALLGAWYEDVDSAAYVRELLAEAGKRAEEDISADDTAAYLGLARDALSALNERARRILGAEKINELQALSDERKAEVAGSLEKAGVTVNTELPVNVIIEVMGLSQDHADYKKLADDLSAKKDAAAAQVVSIKAYQYRGNARAYGITGDGGYTWQEYSPGRSFTVRLDTASSLKGKTIQIARLDGNGTLTYLTGNADETGVTFTTDRFGTFAVGVVNEKITTPAGNNNYTPNTSDNSWKQSQTGQYAQNNQTGTGTGTNGTGTSGNGTGGTTTGSGSSSGRSGNNRNTVNIEDEEVPLAGGEGGIPRTDDTLPAQMGDMWLLVLGGMALGAFSIKKRRQLIR